MADNKDMRSRVKTLWLKGMKAIGNTAANIANNTRYKVDEVTIQNRRREVLGDLANKAYALWLKGESFPQPMIKMLEELEKLDEQLNDMRAEKYAASVRTQSSGTTASDSGDNCERPGMTDVEAEEEISLPQDQSPVSTEINELFDSVPAVSRMAEKVNSSLDNMSECIRSFPSGKDETEKRQD